MFGKQTQKPYLPLLWYNIVFYGETWRRLEVLTGRYGDCGASVMIGTKGGVVTRIAQTTNHPLLKGVPCTAHR